MTDKLSELKETASRKHGSWNKLISDRDIYIAALEQRIEELEEALKELKELLSPGSGYHIAPDDPPADFIEGIRIDGVFERADKALAQQDEPIIATLPGWEEEA